jgi:hypothetical protein
VAGGHSRQHVGIQFLHAARKSREVTCSRDGISSLADVVVLRWYGAVAFPQSMSRRRSFWSGRRHGQALKLWTGRRAQLSADLRRSFMSYTAIPIEDAGLSGRSGRLLRRISSRGM